ncbi:hypothetical protein Gotri_015325, partial [Gossypium trilobum]|nr:hypothetical protein [Gossypium trilobum]
DEKDPYKIPTKQNIRKGLKWLVYGCQPGDSLVFHFSGHGDRQIDYDNDEVDGFDEALCPLDHDTEGKIIDDEINATIGTSGGLAYCFSACDDNQVSADTTAFTKTSTRTGAMTFSFIQAVENEPGLTYGRLLNAMRNAIRDAKAGLRLSGPIATLVNKVFFGSTSQEPQLSSSYTFDIYSKRFVL